MTPQDADDLARELYEFWLKHQDSAFELGRFLFELGQRIKELKAAHPRQKGINKRYVYEKSNIGMSRGPLEKQRRFYLLFRDLVEESKLRQVDTKHARAISDAIHVRTKLAPKAEDFPIPPNEIIDRALDPNISYRTLEDMLRRSSNAETLDDTPVFSKEKEIETFFLDHIDEMKKRFGFNNCYHEVGTGPALHFVDFAWTKTDDQGCQSIILMELKQFASFRDIGQILGYRNELEENLYAGKAKIYLGRRSLSLKKLTPTLVPCDKIEAWLVSHVFSEGAYYAAKGQKISLFRIRDKSGLDSLIGPVGAETLNRERWNQFKRGGRNDNSENLIQISTVR